MCESVGGERVCVRGVFVCASECEGCGCAGVPVPTFGYEWGREAWGNLASVR